MTGGVGNCQSVCRFPQETCFFFLPILSFGGQVLPYIAVAWIGLRGIDGGVFLLCYASGLATQNWWRKVLSFLVLGFESSAFLWGMCLQGFGERALTL